MGIISGVSPEFLPHKVRWCWQIVINTLSPLQNKAILTPPPPLLVHQLLGFFDNQDNQDNNHEQPTLNHSESTNIEVGKDFFQSGAL